jgi:two-component system, cell cycle sensor histidine kinase and response regulator CckA
MRDVDDMSRENALLRSRNEHLLLQLADAQQAMGALAHGEVDAVTLGSTSSTPILLKEAQERLLRSQATLRESNRLLEEAQAIAHVGSWTSGILPTGTIQWSREAARIVSAPSGVPMPVALWLQSVHTDDQERFDRSTLEALTVGYELEHRIVRPDGVVRWVHNRGAVERDAAGLPVRMVGTIQDVTDIHVALEALRTSEADFRLLAEAMPQIVWIAGPDGGNVYFNQHWVDYTGLTLEESLGAGWNLACHPEDRQRAWDAWQSEIPTTTGVYSRERRLRRADGAYTWWLIRGVPILDARGAVAKWFGTATDIDAIKTSEETVRRSEALLRIAGNAAKLGGWSVSVPSHRSTWSDQVRVILEAPAGAEPTLEQALEYYPPEFRQMLGTNLEACERDGTPFDVEVQIVTPKGQRKWVRVIGEAERDASGSVTMVRGGFQDIDDRRRLEDQFRQAQKMEAVGRLAGGVAHDFNNLLSVILSYSELSLGTLRPGDPLRSDLEEIKRAGVRAADLTRQLLAFSRKQVLAPRVVCLGEIVAAMKSMLSRLLGEGISLTVLEPDLLGRVLVDPTQVEQVVMNLAVNARDAMPDGGRLTIGASNVSVEEELPGKPANVPPGRYVMLAVTDTGEGMTEEVRERIFEPFFTTKESGKGTGLGLATVFGIVQQSGGFVNVYSELGRGTTFKVYLPRTDRVAESMSDAPGASVSGGSETILLVEDEEQVRTVACTILRRHGYNVIEAANGGEALMLANDFPSTIALLLTDVVMPRIGGRRLAEELATQRPAMKVLFASGYTDDAILQHGVLESGVPFIQKPFTPQALLRKVREVLDSGAQHASRRP